LVTVIQLVAGTANHATNSITEQIYNNPFLFTSPRKANLMEHTMEGMMRNHVKIPKMYQMRALLARLFEVSCLVLG